MYINVKDAKTIDLMPKYRHLLKLLENISILPLDLPTVTEQTADWLYREFGSRKRPTGKQVVSHCRHQYTDYDRICRFLKTTRGMYTRHNVQVKLYINALLIEALRMPLDWQTATFGNDAPPERYEDLSLGELKAKILHEIRVLAGEAVYHSQYPDDLLKDVARYFKLHHDAYERPPSPRDLATMFQVAENDVDRLVTDAREKQFLVDATLLTTPEQRKRAKQLSIDRHIPLVEVIANHISQHDATLEDIIDTVTDYVARLHPDARTPRERVIEAMIQRLAGMLDCTATLHRAGSHPDGENQEFSDFQDDAA